MIEVIEAKRWRNTETQATTFDYLLKTGGAACRGADIAQIVRLA